jgi:PRC-barrel domain
VKPQTFDSLTESEARRFTGCKVIDDRGKSTGTMEGLWVDPSTHQVAYIGIRTRKLSRDVQVVPVASARILDGGDSIKLQFSDELIKNAPTCSPDTELAEVQKEKVNAYFGRTVSLQRNTPIEEVRPEESIRSGRMAEAESLGPGKDRGTIERRDQAFFNEKGFVTDSMPEVDASQELQRSQNESKIRNRQTQIEQED